MFLGKQDVSFKAMYVGQSNSGCLKPGKVYHVSSVNEEAYHTTYCLKEVNGEFNNSEFVRIVECDSPMILINKKIPKVGERFTAFDGSNSSGESNTITSSPVIYVKNQSLMDRILGRVRVLTQHSLPIGGSARLYTLYY